MTPREQAFAFWKSAVDAVSPARLLGASYNSWPTEIHTAKRIIVVGCGKAGVGMAMALEDLLRDRLNVIEGLVNVPEGTSASLQRIRLNYARPAATNFPTPAGVAGAEEMLTLLASAGPEDVAICLLSGGGSALLPAPVAGVSLEAKLTVTKLLHGCGATIQEMNCVRKHLSRVKGGQLAAAFRGQLMLSLIISDVIGDPLDVIASGPTCADPTTFADALAILERFDLIARTPVEVLAYLRKGLNETPKHDLPKVQNIIVGHNMTALRVVEDRAMWAGYRVLNLGSHIAGDTQEVAKVMAGVVRSIRSDRVPFPSPVCVLMGGETTVNLGVNPGKGGRNQEFVLAMLHELVREGMQDVTILSGGTDGEDGPTDAAGAIADESTFDRANGLSIADHLRRHDAYPFFEATGDLIRIGMTNTNVMDIRMLLIV